MVEKGDKNDSDEEDGKTHSEGEEEKKDSEDDDGDGPENSVRMQSIWLPLCLFATLLVPLRLHWKVRVVFASGDV